MPASASASSRRQEGGEDLDASRRARRCLHQRTASPAPPGARRDGRSRASASPLCASSWARSRPRRRPAAASPAAASHSPSWYATSAAARARAAATDQQRQHADDLLALGRRASARGTRRGVHRRSRRAAGRTGVASGVDARVAISARRDRRDVDRSASVAAGSAAEARVWRRARRRRGAGRSERRGGVVPRAGRASVDAAARERLCRRLRRRREPRLRQSFESRRGGGARRFPSFSRLRIHAFRPAASARHRAPTSEVRGFFRKVKFPKGTPSKLLLARP